MSDPIFVYVEDDAKSREIMSVMMKRLLGHTNVFVYADSDHMIERLQELPGRPDIIFLDIHMKPYDGFTVLEMIREHPEFNNLRVIALTASVMNDEVYRLQTSGFDGAVSKPINHQTFPDIIDRILEGERIWHIS